jgi:hypothetical protein
VEGDGSSFADFVRSVIVFECEDCLIWQPKYYGESKTRMLEVLLGIHQQGCDFMVAGRKVNGRFKVLSDIDIPAEVQHMFQAIPENLFYSDLSSTALRQKAR